MTAIWSIRQGQLGESVPLLLEPRVSATIVYSCLAPAGLFEDDWEDQVPEAFVDAIVVDNLYPACEDIGKPGLWCGDCPFGEVSEE